MSCRVWLWVPAWCGVMWSVVVVKLCVCCVVVGLRCVYCSVCSDVWFSAGRSVCCINVNGCCVVCMGEGIRCISSVVLWCWSGLWVCVQVVWHGSLCGEGLYGMCGCVVNTVRCDFGCKGPCGCTHAVFCIWCMVLMYFCLYVLRSVHGSSVCCVLLGIVCVWCASLLGVCLWCVVV